MIVRKPDRSIFECDCCGFQYYLFNMKPREEFQTLRAIGWSIYKGKLYCPECAKILDKKLNSKREKYFNKICKNV